MKRICSDEVEELISCVELPLEIWQEILSYLDHYVLFKRATVCKTWQKDEFLYRCIRGLKTNETGYTDNMMLNKMKNLSSLFMTEWLMKHKITDDGLKGLFNIRTLVMTDMTGVTDNGIKQLTGITSLRISGMGHLTDNAIKDLVQLEMLCFDSANCRITDSGLKTLLNLTALSPPKGATITNECLVQLIHLKALSLAYNYTITDDGLLPLTRLKNLDLSGKVNAINGTSFVFLASRLTTLMVNDKNFRIKDEHITLLTKLRHLHLEDNHYISNATVTVLTNLRSLFINSATQQITPDCRISLLTNLTTLSVGSHPIMLTNKTLDHLSNLNRLYVNWERKQIFIKANRPSLEVSHYVYNRSIFSLPAAHLSG